MKLCLYINGFVLVVSIRFLRIDKTFFKQNVLVFVKYYDLTEI